MAASLESGLELLANRAQPVSVPPHYCTLALKQVESNWLRFSKVSIRQSRGGNSYLPHASLSDGGGGPDEKGKFTRCLSQTIRVPMSNRNRVRTAQRHRYDGGLRC